MASRPPARRRTRHIPRILVVGALVGIAATAAIVAVPGHQSLASSSTAGAPVAAPPASSTTASAVSGRSAGHLGAPGEGGGVLRTAGGGALGETDGAVPNGTTVFATNVPGVTNLAPALLSALRRAATAAGADGVRFLVDSGWRSAAYQQQLLRQAISKYGSEGEAARWVASPDRSEHVSGNAVDIGPARAGAWLSRHGAAYGLCQIYRNELWHYELRPSATAHGCPPMYADPTQDPRMQE